MKKYPGGIAACSRWLSAVCETTGSRAGDYVPRAGAPAFLSRTSGARPCSEPLRGSESLPVSGGFANDAQPPATSCNPSGIKRTCVRDAPFIHSPGRGTSLFGRAPGPLPVNPCRCPGSERFLPVVSQNPLYHRLQAVIPPGIKGAYPVWIRVSPKRLSTQSASGCATWSCSPSNYPGNRCV